MDVREHTTPVLASSVVGVRPRVCGKFLFLGEEKFYVRGVTYGTFRPDTDGNQYPDPSVVDQDFARMAASGVNAVRTYTVPPRWLLDTAQRHGLRVMVGLPWEGHVAFLDTGERSRFIEQSVRAGVRACARHSAVLCYVIGNEIPATIVRWHGRRRVERFLERLYRAAKAEDPEGLVTYANYPSTEYLRLTCVDLFCFNLYLEEQEPFEAYLARLHNIAGDRPVIITEIGLDSRTHGEEAQARVLEWQIRTTFAAGCAGTFVFAWTDEWHRGGYDIEDWNFGLTSRNRNPKPALAAVCRAFAEVPFPRDLPWPRVSVVVCSYNGERTIRECLEGLLDLEYPDYEVIVVDDGSSDSTAMIASEYDFRLISTENRGLSDARNTGMKAATGEIVAYIDDDTRPDRHWLTYLAAGFLNSKHAGIGGPNIAPSGDGLVAECVASAPGNPVHVLLSDQEAEHIPGCNMAFRKDCLQAADGFDTQFRVAGDDADLCWRMRELGWTLGFAPAAMVWHHRRSSVRAYWRQQNGYGKADAMLARKWPEKYNAVGNLRWEGRLYGKGVIRGIGWRQERIYHGTWGAALFQSVYQPTPGVIDTLPLAPEWHLFGIVLLALATLSVDWTPMVLTLPLLVFVVAASLVQAFAGAAETFHLVTIRSQVARLKLLGVTAFLHLIQPLARLRGRFAYHGTTGQKLSVANLSLSRTRCLALWSEWWRAPEEWLRFVEAALRASGVAPIRGGDYDHWDLELRGGRLGAARLRIALEEHGGGKQLVRFRVWPRVSIAGIGAGLLLSALCAGAAFDYAWFASAVLGGGAAMLFFRILWESAGAISAVLQALEEPPSGTLVLSVRVKHCERREAL